MTRPRLQLRLFLTFALLALMSAAAAALIVVLVIDRHIEDEATQRLGRAANFVHTLLEFERDRVLSDSGEVAARLSLGELEPERAQRILAVSRQRIRDDYLAVVDGSGQVLAEDPPDGGVGGGGGEVVRQALAGRAVALLQVRDGRLRAEAAAPIHREGEVVGAAVAGDLLDSRFLGLIKRSAGLDAALIVGDRLLASTLQMPREEVEQALVAHVQSRSSLDPLAAGEPVAARLGGERTSYLGLLAPLAGPGGRTVAVLFLGLPESQLFARQLDLLVPLLSLGLVVLMATLGASFLVARTIAIHLEVETGAAAGQERVALDGLQIDRPRHEARLHGRLVPLTRTEFELLWALAETPGKVLTRNQLLERVWGSDFAADSGVVDAHIANLRRKLDADPEQPRYILTVRGVGFKFREPSPRRHPGQG